MKFGQGSPTGHWGGRYIWQLEDYKKLIICSIKGPNSL